MQFLVRLGINSQFSGGTPIIDDQMANMTYFPNNSGYSNIHAPGFGFTAQSTPQMYFPTLLDNQFII